MDQVRIGRFIASERRQKGLTQRQLADELGISDKTISKWETGNGFPEISLLLPLCEQLNITVNELLSAERLSDNEYKQKAEENMVDMIKEKEANRRSLRLTSIVGFMSSIVFVVLMMIIAVYGHSMPKTAAIILAVMGIGVFAVGLYVATQGERTIGYYKCPDCGTCFVPTYAEYMKSVHFWQIRRLRCPNCSHKAWMKKVMSRDED
jgi:transcriptional regulator with XRE-family HTH domain/DNA-directed RNA polymerase subunit RPC12/RpoP